jgi:hypothetical protein
MADIRGSQDYQLEKPYRAMEGQRGTDYAETGIKQRINTEKANRRNVGEHMSMKYRMDQDEIEKRIIGGAMNCLFGGWLLDKYVKAKVAPDMFKCQKRSKAFAAMVAEYEYERGEALPFSADDMLAICMGHKVSRQDAEEWRDLCPDRRTGERAMYTLLEYVAVQSITETLEDAREKIGTDKTTPESIAAEALDVLKVIISTSPEGAGMESPAEMATKIKAEAIESKALADALLRACEWPSHRSGAAVRGQDGACREPFQALGRYRSKAPVRFAGYAAA